MIILSVKLKNFGPYYGEKIFTFSKGVNIITGDRHTGKSQLAKAITWLITDQYWDAAHNQSLPTAAAVELIVSEKAVHLSNGEPVEVSVEILLEDDNQRYHIIRRFNYKFGCRPRSTIQLKETDINLLTQIHVEEEVIRKRLDFCFPLGLRKALWLTPEIREYPRSLEELIVNLSPFERINSYIRDILVRQNNNDPYEKRETLRQLFEITSSTKDRIINQAIKEIEEEANRHLNELLRYFDVPRYRIRLKKDSSNYLAGLFFVEDNVEVSPNRLLLSAAHLSVRLATGLIALAKSSLSFTPLLDKTELEITWSNEKSIKGLVSCFNHGFEQSLLFTYFDIFDSEFCNWYSENKEIVMGKLYRLVNTNHFDLEQCETLIQDF